MKYYIVITIILTTLFSCSRNTQEEIMITRFRDYNNSDKRIQEIYIKGDKKIWEKNYTSNGWQVLDSVVYRENDIITYEPQYKDAREIVGYSKRESIDELMSKSNKTSKYPLKDKHELSGVYLNDIQVIHKLMGINTFETKSENVLKANFIPTVLTRYGIPYNEVLDSCKYSITKEGLLKNDKFYFQDFTVNRDYEYDGLALKTVNILRVDKVSNQIERITENLKIEKIK